MKFENSSINLTTGAAVALAASLLWDNYNVQVPSSPESTRFALWAVAGLFCLTNLTGIPAKMVDEHWEKSGFGEVFLPVAELNNKQRRRLAGCFELAGILLSIFGSSHTQRGAGFAMIMTTFGRGALVNTRISFGKALGAASVSLLAGYLFLEQVRLKNEL
jgi:hypothetical protein